LHGQVIANGMDMHAIDKSRVRLQNMPTLNDELKQASPGLLGCQ
jgi:hypothetical protein